MFSMHDFILTGLMDAVGKMADYQVILNAAGWHQKGVLEESDLARIQEAIDKKNTPVVIPEVVEDIPTTIPEVTEDIPTTIPETNETV